MPSCVCVVLHDLVDIYLQPKGTDLDVCITLGLVYSVKNQQTESLLSKLGVNKEFFSKSHDQVHSIAPSPSSTLHDEDGDDNVDDGSDEDNSVEREETGDDHECAHETNAHHAAPSNPEEIEL
eukprot:TRINITY_DN2698_c0_g1_i3.p1 TRINITY_DN2698_c0_g1~~TRINITY_DN2698_c0_g1_i3.p1  ORF type:complete len:123 (-),score=28.59 TRINITY_DN2698_c0_g1_i3:210-578(-)